jgi:predicted site-specific integrase-resolvase
VTPADLQLLTIPQLAELAGESVRTIKRRIQEGRIDPVHLSRRATRIPLAEAQRYLRASEGGTVEPPTD